MPLAGGIIQHGYQCGMVWGAVLAAGAHSYYLHGSGNQSEVQAVEAAKKLVELFRIQNKTINCIELTSIDKSSTGLQMFVHFFIKGGTISCLRRAIKYARTANLEIGSALTQITDDQPVNLIGCTSILADKLGISELHRAMIAGFAGGIGLCGNACGALGAAVWIMTMRDLHDEDQTVNFKNPRVINLISRFLKYTDYEFECAEITGRQFSTYEEHARFIKEGGCSKLIELLAEPESS